MNKEYTITKTYTKGYRLFFNAKITYDDCVIKTLQENVFIEEKNIKNKIKLMQDVYLDSDDTINRSDIKINIISEIEETLTNIKKDFK